MPSRWIAVTLAAVLAAPSIVLGAALAEPWIAALSPDPARHDAPRADGGGAPGFGAPSPGADAELGWTEGTAGDTDASLAVPRAAATTYSYLSRARPGVGGLPPSILASGGLGDHPARARPDRSSEVTYAVVESSAPPHRLAGSLPAATALLATVLCVLGALGWRRQCRHRGA